MIPRSLALALLLLLPLAARCGGGARPRDAGAAALAYVPRHAGLLPFPSTDLEAGDWEAIYGG